MTNQDKIKEYFKGSKESINYHSISLKTGKVSLFHDKRKETTNVLTLIEVIQYHDKERDVSYHRYYHNEFFIGVMVCFCGYDRSPKRKQYIEDLLTELYEVTTNEEKAINSMEDKAYQKLDTKIYDKLKHWIEDI
jgi:hypothetical protein